MGAILLGLIVYLICSFVALIYCLIVHPIITLCCIVGLFVIMWLTIKYSSYSVDADAEI